MRGAHCDVAARFRRSGEGNVPLEPDRSRGDLEPGLLDGQRGAAKREARGAGRRTLPVEGRDARKPQIPPTFDTCRVEAPDPVLPLMVEAPRQGKVGKSEQP